MGNIISYLRWRGDFTFRQMPFNEVDNLILSELAYLTLQDIVPDLEDGKSVLLKDAADLYRNKRRQETENPEFSRLLEEMAKSRRFCMTRLSGYEDIIDTDQEMTQFAAIRIELEDGTMYIAFRGTDSTIVGWREDFCISFQVVSAQRRAVQYLDAALEECQCSFRVGGHSKGGHLAVYAAMMCEERYKKKIVEIYNNDGPGICPSMVDSLKYEKMKEKIHKIVPEFSIIGQLFENESDCRIVQSSGDGVLQHDAFTWQVERDQFIEKDALTKKCRLYNQIFGQWIESVDMEQRQVFVDDFFNALSANGAKTLMEVTGGGINGFEAILLAMGKSDKRSKIVAGKLIRSFCHGIGSIDFKRLIREKKIYQGIGLFLTGGFMVAFPGGAQRIMGTAVFLWLLFFCGMRLFQFYKMYQRGEMPEKAKVIFYSIIVSVELFCIIKNSIIVISTNFILGFFFGMRAWRQAKCAARKKNETKYIWILPALDSVLASCLGIIAVAAYNDIKTEHIIVAGTYLTVYGMVEIGKQLYRNAEMSGRK